MANQNGDASAWEKDRWVHTNESTFASQDQIRHDGTTPKPPTPEKPEK